MYISEEESDSASILESLLQRLSDSVLIWWKETGGVVAQQTLAELVGGVRARGGGVRLSNPC